MSGGEAAVVRIVNHGADDVGGQHVRRELNPLEAEIDASGQRFEGERFCQAGHAFEKDVAIGDQRNEQAVEQLLLPDNHPCHLLLQRAHPCRTLLHRVLHRLDCRVRSGIRRNRFGRWCRHQFGLGSKGGPVTDAVKGGVIRGRDGSGQYGNAGIVILNCRSPFIVIFHILVLFVSFPLTASPRHRSVLLVIDHEKMAAGLQRNYKFAICG